MDGTRALNGLGQLFELGCECLELGGEETSFVLGDGFRCIDQGIEHHRDARKDRFLDPFERLVEACLLVSLGHSRHFDEFWLSDDEIRRQ